MWRLYPTLSAGKDERGDKKRRRISAIAHQRCLERRVRCNLDRLHVLYAVLGRRSTVFSVLDWAIHIQR